MKCILVFFCLCVAAYSQFKYPPVMSEAKAEIYKTVGDTQLKLYIFESAGHQASDQSAAIVFCFGGGWTNGSPAQFENHCKYLV